MPSSLSSSVPLPLAIDRLSAVRVALSMSLALTNNSAWVITRAPLSSAIASSVTAVVVGASLTGATSMVSTSVVCSPLEASVTVKLKLSIPK